MQVPHRPSQIRRMLDSRLKRVTAHQPLLACSLSLVYKRCGQPGCSCHHGGPAHPAHHLTYKEAGKTRTVYVPQDLVAEVQTWVNHYQHLKSLIHEISQLTLGLVRHHVQDRKRRQGRP